MRTNDPRISQWRAAAQAGTLTLDDLRQAIALLREARVGAPAPGAPNLLDQFLTQPK